LLRIILELCGVCFDFAPAGDIEFRELANAREEDLPAVPGARWRARGKDLPTVPGAR